MGPVATSQAGFAWDRHPDRRKAFVFDAADGASAGGGVRRPDENASRRQPPEKAIRSRLERSRYERFGRLVATPPGVPTLPFEILARGESFVVIAKPSGLVVHRGFSGERDSVVDRLRAAGRGDLHTVHRLDRPTSGALLLATGPDAARFFARAFEGGLVEKTYLALVRGVPPDEVRVDHPIPSDEGGPRVPAITRFVRIATVETSSSLREPRYSLVRAFPETGRFHQIRRHLAHLRHPIVGDTNYGKGEHDRYCRQAFGLHRLALHANALAFPLPEGGTFDVSAEVPPDLQATFAAMGLPRQTFAQARGERPQLHVLPGGSAGLEGVQGPALLATQALVAALHTQMMP